MGIQSLNNLWVEYLQELGYTGKDFNDLLQRALRFYGSSQRKNLNDLWKEYLTERGYSGSITQMQYDWLGDKGYTGTLNDRFHRALRESNLFTFNPESLFTDGQQGAWYDPSDLDTLYQDSAGTTPVTADGDPVGLMLDKSGNGNHASQSTTAAKPTYRTNGTLHWLEHDNVDDLLEFVNPGYSSNISVAIAMKSSGNAYAWRTNINPDASLRVGLALSGNSTSTTAPFSGTEERVNGELFLGDTVDLWNLASGNAFVGTCENYDTSDASLEQTHSFVAYRNVRGGGSFYGYIEREGPSFGSQRAALETFLAAKAGVSP